MSTFFGSSTISAVWVLMAARKRASASAGLSAWTTRASVACAHGQFVPLIAVVGAAGQQ